MSITLIGMPGCGKSTISKFISEINKNYNLIELDQIIEKINNDTISNLIKKNGENSFGKLEEEALLSITFDKSLIISTGGSVIYSGKGMEHLQNEKNTIIYLFVDFETLAERTDNFTNRGIIFNGLTPKELFYSRHELYKKYSNKIINCVDLSIEEICQKVLKVN
tara:strand:+ start:158 stop:652 length:495 start_codon:yes stop_codon:yes gene_type:complete